MGSTASIHAILNLPKALEWRKRCCALIKRGGAFSNTTFPSGMLLTFGNKLRDAIAKSGNKLTCLTRKHKLTNTNKTRKVNA